MAAHYVNVTQDEIEKHLLPQGFKRITLQGTAELVYSKRVDRDGLQLSLRIYTGIAHGASRSVGTDAIRCTIFQRDAENGEIRMVGGSKRVHRVGGWRKNLQNRINSWYNLIGPVCPECGSLMVERDGRNGKFYSCSRYPDCKKTSPLKKKPSKEECEAEAEIQTIEGSCP